MAGWKLTTPPVADKDCEEYAGYDFSINGRAVKFRVAKTTPIKHGQFVTFWKRLGRGHTMPYDVKDQIDLFIVCVRDGENVGQFVFPLRIFELHGIISNDNQVGKRALRVYPPWVITESSQATKTQNWQTKFFIHLNDKYCELNLEKIKSLYEI